MGQPERCREEGATDRKRELAIGEDAAWAELAAVVGSLSDEQMELPGYFEEGWSAKNLLAHLAGWMAEASCVLEQIRAGTYRSRRIDVDAMNAEFFEANRDQPLPVIRAEWYASRTRMLQEWDALPEVTPQAEGWFVESGAQHYGEHIDQLRAWSEQLRDGRAALTRLGVMGGTFDPIHHGHLVTAEEALWQFGLEEVVFVPTGQPWMKAEREVTPAEHRYLMTVIATASNPRFSVSRTEVDRDGPTYTVDTLAALREEHGPDVDLYFVTGADAMLEILQWKDPEEVLGQAHFIAATRPGYDLARFEGSAPIGKGRVSVMQIPALAISSTDIRRRVREGEPIRYLVPEGVHTYIHKFELYGPPAGSE